MRERERVGTSLPVSYHSQDTNRMSLDTLCVLLLASAEGPCVTAIRDPGKRGRQAGSVPLPIRLLCMQSFCSIVARNNSLEGINVKRKQTQRGGNAMYSRERVN